MPVDRIARFLPLLLVLACGAPEDASAPDPTGDREVDEAAEWAAARRTDPGETADGAPVDDDLPADQAGGEERFPCTVIDRAAIEELLGNPVEDPAWTQEEVADEEATFAAETCSWLTFAEGASEIILQVSRAEHFENGEVVCWKPEEHADGDDDGDESAGADGPDPGSPADDGVADSEAGPDEDLPSEPSPIEITDLGSSAWWLYDPVTAFGSLQICHPSGRIAVEVNADDGETARRAAVELGRRVISSW